MTLPPLLRLTDTAIPLLLKKIAGSKTNSSPDSPTAFRLSDEKGVTKKLPICYVFLFGKDVSTILAVIELNLEQAS